MKLKSTFVLAAGAILGMAPYFAWAQGGQPGQVEAKLVSVKIVTDKSGKESAVPADKALPGETIEYRATYTNKGKDAVRNLEATVPVPGGMEYVARTTKPGTALASLDGRTFESIPLKRKVKTPDGKMVEQEVPVTEYRMIRWKVGELAAGANTIVSARMRLSPIDTPPPPAPATGGAK